MPVTARTILRRLLTTGYFPRELPPTFSTRRYGLIVSRLWNSRPGPFTSTRTTASPAKHSLVRSGPLRRQLSIPNPILFPQACDEVASHWATLEAAAMGSPFTRSRPVLHSKGARCFLPLVPRQGDLVPYKAAARAGARVLVSTDIARFYASIYTHSVPWALHGKALAKKKQRDYSLLGNRLDRALRLMSAGQTIGIPIGPDISLVIAETLLADVDRQLSAQFPHVQFLRYVDEYEIAARNHEEAQAAIAQLQQLLAGFELELNALKTSLQTLPCRIELPWVSDLRSRRIRAAVPAQATDLVALFDEAFAYAQKQPEAPVLRYLMGRLKNQRVELQNWRLYQNLLLQCMTVEPATIQGAMTTLLPHLENNFGLERGAFLRTLNGIIEYHGLLGHGNEVSWALWSLMTLDLRISRSAVRALEKMTDPAVTLLALHAESLGLLEDPLDKQSWVALAKRESLYDENWLLVYEGVKKGWLPTNSAFVEADPGFGFLWRQGVVFYDTAAILQPKPTGVPPSIGIAPSFY